MMRSIQYKTVLKKVIFAAGLLFVGATAASAQSVNLTAGASNFTLPDGNVVPMWGYTCADAASVATSGAKCSPATLNTNGQWSPIIITVAPGSLTISLTNNLPAKLPTSLMIVGQVGGGLGTERTTSVSPDHSSPQSTTWPIAGDSSGPQFTPPSQPDRVRSLTKEVTAGNTTSLMWLNLKPGTYLIESATHPSIQVPMGLYGVLVVTTPASGTIAAKAYPDVTYDADVPLLLSEIDPVQNKAVDFAVNTPNFDETKVWSGSPVGAGTPALVQISERAIRQPSIMIRAITSLTVCLSTLTLCRIRRPKFLLRQSPEMFSSVLLTPACACTCPP